MATPRKQSTDTLIIGAGPTGLAAALYAAREGLQPLVLDKSIVGGMAAVTDKIDNYPGFENGVGGLELADHLYNHAIRFGAEVRTGVDVTALKPVATGVTVETSAGPVNARAVLIATGSTYRQLEVPGGDKYIGRGVHFCATCDAPLYRDKDVIVVGGGNSAVQESLFIARFAKFVTILVRGSELSATKVLEEELAHLPNISFQYNAEVIEIRGDDGHATGVRVRDTLSGEEHDRRADAIFEFVGLVANTEAFANLQLDEDAFVVTKADFLTSMPGVYAAGDVRSGATWQIASAIGEGVSAAIEIRKYLAREKSLTRRALTDVRRRQTTV